MNPAAPGPPSPSPAETVADGPHGVAVRYAPTRGGGLWHEVHELGNGRLAVAVGRAADPALGPQIGARVGAVLRATGDPLAALAPAAESSDGAAALCAVIDRLGGAVTCSCLGELSPVIAAPGVAHIFLRHEVGEPASAPLPPAATVLLCTTPGDRIAAVLDRSTTLHPRQVADRIAEELAPLPHAAVALVYRHAPDPLELTVPATPASLAAIRSQLRHWLTLTGVDAETAADSLLAVGEAASNATEHSVLGARRSVDLTISAAVADDRLRFTVADNGRWKTPPVAPGHRGHGIRLINALVDDADLVTDEQGTTIDMVKELRR